LWVGFFKPKVFYSQTKTFATMKRMERILQSLIWLAIITSGLLISCQNEDLDINTGSNSQTLSKSSNLTGFLSRISMENTVDDNVLDSTSCFKIKLPAEVLINEEFSFQVNSEDDYETVAGLLQQPIGNGTIDLVFPITVIFPDYSEQIVTSQAQFDQLSNCEETNPGQAPIGCISLQYPITIFGYNSNFQLAQTYVVDSDIEFFLFLLNLEINEYYAISYPISVTNSNGQTVTINNNSELEALILQTISICSNEQPICPNPHILINDLIIYMPFANETRDLISLDYATSESNPTFVNDRSGNENGAISFNGENFLSLATTENRNIEVGDSISISVWVKMQNTNPSDLERIFEKSDGEFSNNQPSFGLGVYDLNAPFFYNTAPEVANIFDSSWQQSQTLPNDIENWHHIVITVETDIENFSIVRLYRDGLLRNSIEAQGLFINTQVFNYFIGKNLQADIDDLRVYRRLLNIDEINTLFELEGDTNTCF
jgi:hypothetical protein